LSSGSEEEIKRFVEDSGPRIAKSIGLEHQIHWSTTKQSVRAQSSIGYRIDEKRKGISRKGFTDPVWYGRGKSKHDDNDETPNCNQT
jgi:hypothetical protein